MKTKNKEGKALATVKQKNYVLMSPTALVVNKKETYVKNVETSKN